MPENTPTPEQRDARLRRTRRLRAGVVGAGVLGSLGVATVVAVPALAHTAAAVSGQQVDDGDGESFSRWQQDTGSTTDQEQDQQDPWGLSQAPDLQQGGGTPHGSTGGS